jgi:predicted nucleic acid-binding protein
MPTTISIDASVAVKTIVEEEHSDRARALVAANDMILAPAHAYAEIAEIIYRKTNAGDVEEKQALWVLAELPKILTLVPLDTIVADAFAIARSIRHSVYDCLYIAAAQRHGVKLVTADRRMLRKTHGTGYAPIVIDLESTSAFP